MDDKKSKDEYNNQSDPYAHLRKHQWKPGESGNPNGRPKTRTMRERLKSLIDVGVKELPFAVEVCERLGIDNESIDAMDLGDVLMLTGVFQAMKGRAPQFNEIISRLDGKVQANIHDQEIVVDPKAGEVPLEQRRNEALALYQSIIDDPAATPRDKMTAQQGINQILGLVIESETAESAAEHAEKVREALAFMMEQSTADADEIKQDT